MSRHRPLAKNQHLWGGLIDPWADMYERSSRCSDPTFRPSGVGSVLAAFANGRSSVGRMIQNHPPNQEAV
jgi:hypothetical protein